MDELFAKLMEALSSVEGSVVTVALVLDFAFRMIPSKKPLSVLHVIAKGAGMVGEVLVRTAKLADSVLPQNIKKD